MRPLLLSVLLVSPVAGAAPVRISIARSSTAPAADRARVRAVLNGVARELRSSGLVSPKRVSVSLAKELSLSATPQTQSASANYAGGAYHIVLGAKLTNGALATTPHGADTVAAHELGHTFFQASLMKWAPRYAAAYTRADRYKVAQAANDTAWSNTVASFGDRYAGAKTDTERTQIDKQLAAVTKVRARLQTRYDADSGKVSGAQAYHELFADSVATLYFKEGRGVADALDQTGKTPQNELRDFTANDSVARTKALMTDRAHDLAAPVRSFLWKTYERRANESVDPRPQMLTALARHSAALLESRMAHGHANLETLSVRGFSDALRAALSNDPAFSGAPN